MLEKREERRDPNQKTGHRRLSVLRSGAEKNVSKAKQINHKLQTDQQINSSPHHQITPSPNQLIIKLAHHQIVKSTSIIERLFDAAEVPLGIAFLERFSFVVLLLTAGQGDLQFCKASVIGE